MADETKRVIDQTTDSSLSAGDFVIVDSQSEGTRKFDLGTELTDIKQDLGIVNSFLTIGDTLYKTFAFVKGTIRDNTNVEVSNDSRIRSNYIDVYTKEITLIIGNGLSVYLFEFDSSKDFVYEGGWHTGTKKVKLKDSTKYVRIIAKNSSGDSTITPSDGNNISAYEYSVFTQKEYKVLGSELEWHSGYISNTTGEETDSGETSYMCTNYIKLPKCLAFNTIKFAAYASNKAASITFYEDDLTFISANTRADASPLEVTIPNDSVYVRLTTYPSSLSTSNAFFSVYVNPMDELVNIIKTFNGLLISENENWSV